MISAKASAGFCNPKNKIDQVVFKINCIKNTPKATLTSFLSTPFFQTKNAEIPMSKKSVVQTGPKTQLGGANSGRINFVYQPLIELEVKMDPIPPANCGAKIEITNLNIFLFFIN